MDKKAQGMSLNTIIVAIIVLIVLVVLIMVFTGYFGTRFTPQVTSCANAGGECKFECGFDAFGNAVAQLDAQCSGAQLCCSKGLGSGEAKPQEDSQCGQDGHAPCPDSGSCASGLTEVSGICRSPCSASPGCSIATSAACTTAGGSVVSGYCSSGVCCSI